MSTAWIIAIAVYLIVGALLAAFYIGYYSVTETENKYNALQIMIALTAIVLLWWIVLGAAVGKVMAERNAEFEESKARFERAYKKVDEEIQRQRDRGMMG